MSDLPNRKSLRKSRAKSGQSDQLAQDAGSARGAAMKLLYEALLPIEQQLLHLLSALCNQLESSGDLSLLPFYTKSVHKQDVYHTLSVDHASYIAGMTEDEYKIEIGKRIAKAREDCELSQRALAKKIGVSTSTLGMYEQGRRKPGHVEIIAIAKETGSDPTYLMCLNHSETRGTPQWLDPRAEKLPPILKEAIRLKIARYIEMAEKLPPSTFSILFSEPTSRNYADWERAIEAHYRSIVNADSGTAPVMPDRRQADERRKGYVIGPVADANTVDENQEFGDERREGNKD
jgi:transcriptional regulator with XRE-family HTH domain